jgi:4-hydroxy-4-methyl-2-oxoglutarate aldolase
MTAVIEQFMTGGERVSDELVSAFSRQAVSTVYEASGRYGAMEHTIRPMSPALRLCGHALTVRSQPGDNLTLHAAIALARPGDVIVADVGGYCEAGHWGEILTVAAQARGIVGLVIDGSVRDVAPIQVRGFPMFARAVSMKATVKESAGLINHPVMCGGVLVHAGDLVLGDDDGVVIVERERAEEVLRATIEREEREAVVMQRLVAGELTLDVLGFRRALERQGLQV